MLNLRTGKNDLAPVALTRRESIKGLAAILAAGCAPAIASAAARGNARMVGARTAARTASWLPYDAEVEYIQGERTAYIDTLVPITLSTEFKISVLFTKTLTTDRLFFGAGIQGWKTGSMFIDAIASRTDACLFGSSSTQSSFTVINTPITASLLGNIYTVNGSSSTISRSQLISGQTINLFFINFNGAILSSSTDMGLRYYYAKLYNDSTLVFDGIPVRKGTVGYMYDKVSGKLFGSNSSSESFTVGPDVSAANGV